MNNKTENKLLYQKFSDKLNKQHFLNNSVIQLNERDIPDSTGEICYSDLNKKTIDLLLKNKNLRICLQSNTNCYAYGPTPGVKNYMATEFGEFSNPIPEEYISEIEIKKALSDEYGSFGELYNPITFGRKIIPEDIPNLQKLGMYISVFQDVTDWFVRLIDELEQSFIEFLKEALEEDFGSLDDVWHTPVCMQRLNEFMRDHPIKAYVGHHIDAGGLNCDTATHIGYTIDGDFGITNQEMMTRDMTWRLDSDLFFYNKP